MVHFSLTILQLSICYLPPEVDAVVQGYRILAFLFRSNSFLSLSFHSSFLQYVSPCVSCSSAPQLLVLELLTYMIESLFIPFSVMLYV